jgi:predicted kinase
MRGHEGAKRKSPYNIGTEINSKAGKYKAQMENRVYSTLYQKAQLVTKTIQT